MRLKRNERRLLVAVDKYGTDALALNLMPARQLIGCAVRLQDEGLVFTAYSEGYELVDIRLSNAGKAFLLNHPHAFGDISWSFVMTCITAVAAIVSAVTVMIR